MRGPDGWHLFYGGHGGAENIQREHATSDDLLTFQRFLDAASKSPRPCQVWPQIWPTGKDWTEETARRHPPDAVLQRAEEILALGADGVYFFNFCCFYDGSRLFQEDDQRIFGNLP